MMTRQQLGGLSQFLTVLSSVRLNFKLLSLSPLVNRAEFKKAIDFIKTTY